MLRAWLACGVVVLAAVVAALAGPASALAVEEKCPGVRGGAAAIGWGVNGTEQIGAGFVSAFENAPEPVTGLSGATQIKVGFKLGVALLGNCTLEAWGSNEYGQLGNGNQQRQAHPVPVRNLTEVQEIAVGNAHGMALLYNGTVWTWGASEFGERGNKEKGFERTARQNEPSIAEPRDEPIKVPGLSGVVQIAAGGLRDYALLSDGEVLAWGGDPNGQLGVGEPHGKIEQCYGEVHTIHPLECVTVPIPVEVGQLGALTGVERIAAGEEDAFAVRDGGKEVLAWGNGAKGELGDGATASSPSPVRVALEAPTPVREIAAGGQQVLARLAEGGVYSWGGDGSGQLGFEAAGEPSETCGAHLCSTIPQPVLPLDHVVQVTAGEGVSVALKEEEGGARAMYSFGGTGHYELLGLGNAAIQSIATPTLIEGFNSVSAVSASGTTVVALLQSGSAGTPSLAVSASEDALTPSWHVKAEQYSVRARAVGTREFTHPQEGSCHTECSVKIGGLKPEPYEVFLKTPGELKEGKEKIRKIVATPVPPASFPANTAAPTISGSPAIETGKLRFGQTLTAGHGTWTGSPTFEEQWLRCIGFGEAGVAEELGEECEKVGSGPTYTVQTADVSHTIILLVEAKNGSGTTSAASQPELILASGEETQPSYPIKLTSPTITGPAVEGDTLTAHHGTYENNPTGYEDRFIRCKGHTAEGTGATCSTTPLAIGETYVPVAADVGQWIEVQERAENPGGFEVVPSKAVQIAPRFVPANTAPPTISGTIEQGQVLTVHEGSWTNAAMTPHWKWLRCAPGGGSCVEIEGATNETYALGPEDVGHAIEIAESVENGVGRSAEVDSAATATVPTPPPSAPEALSTPTISGTLEQGRTLSVHGASWSGEVKTFTYQWKRCEVSSTNCRAIAGATSTSYALNAVDVGKTIVMKETATNAAGSGVSSSEATARVIGAVPVASSVPVIRGNAQEGQGLTEFHATWSNEPTIFSYQWQRCNSSGGSCAPISGATGRSYVTTPGDVGDTLRIEEAASNGTGSGSGALSSHTSMITSPAPANTAPPTLEGTAVEGETLTAHEGSWSNSPSGKADRWLRCEEDGACSVIEGASSGSYTLGAADVGYSVEVRETASNAGGWEAAVSEALPVGGKPVPYVTRISPVAGPEGGGTAVTITGGNFLGTSAVEFGFAGASSYELVSPNTIRAVAPAGSGTVYVTVTTGEGTSKIVSAARFTYGKPPSASGVSPKEGPDTGGTTVTIMGSNLEEATAVKFGSSDAESFGVRSASTIEAITPAGSGTVGVTVTTPYGTTTAGSPEQYAYVRTGAPPTITKLSEKKGPPAGGTVLMITGRGFFGASAVSFGSSAPASGFTAISSTSISVTSPPGPAGTLNVMVTNEFGTSSPTTKDRFKYENPVIASVSPKNGPKAGGTLVTITGNGFQPGEGGTSFKFGRGYATAVECVSTSECTMLSPSAAHKGTIEIRAKANKVNSKKNPEGDYTFD